MGIQYVIGDATHPIGSGNRLIMHICNDVGGWGAGFVLAVSKRWKKPEAMYRKWASENNKLLPLGEVQFVEAAMGITIANMVAQTGMQWRSGAPPIRYEALRSALIQVRDYAQHHDCSIHAPRIGAGLAGGDWEKIESIIVDELCNYGISVTVYDLEVPENLNDEIDRRKHESS